MVKYKILWIDDQHDLRDIKAKKLHADLISNEENLKNIKYEDYDLILIDYNLAKAFNTWGYQLGTLIREKAPTVPIYVVSDYIFSPNPNPQKKNARFFCETNFEKVVNFKDLNTDYIRYDAEYLRALRKNIPRSVSEAVDLLRPPASVKEKTQMAIPPEVGDKRAGQSKCFFSLIRWVTQILMKNPGILYDKKNLCAHFGITEGAFNKIKKHFNSAMYSGIFSKSNQEYWWVNEVDRLVFLMAEKKMPEKTSMNIPFMMEKLFSLRERDLKKCIVCNKKYPDILAWDRDTENSFKNIHFSCSEEDSTRPKRVFFDNPRRFPISKQSKVT